MVCPPCSMFCTVISLRYCQGGPVLPCKAKRQELLVLQSSVRVQQYGTSQQTRYIEPLLVQCWPAVYDVGPTMNEQWLNVSCLWDSWWLTSIFVLKYGNVCQMGLCHSAVFSLLLYDNIGIQSQHVVTAYLKSEQLLHFLLWGGYSYFTCILWHSTLQAWQCSGLSRLPGSPQSDPDVVEDDNTDVPQVDPFVPNPVTFGRNEGEVTVWLGWRYILLAR